MMTTKANKRGRNPNSLFFTPLKLSEKKMLRQRLSVIWAVLLMNSSLQRPQQELSERPCDRAFVKERGARLWPSPLRRLLPRVQVE